MNWRVLVTLALVLAALLSGWSVWKQHRQEQVPTAAAARSDYVLEEFELVALNKQGKESFTLRGPRLARQPAKKTIDIATPLFVIPAPEGSSGQAWEVRAKNGWVSADGDELRLRGAVRGTSTGPGPLTVLTTEEMNVLPEKRRANAPGKVVITRPGSILSGRGLQLDLATKRYQLKSEVRHRYVQTPR
jgi:lipopolysaccharide export system protein LptC